MATTSGGNLQLQNGARLVNLATFVTDAPWPWTWHVNTEANNTGSMRINSEGDYSFSSQTVPVGLQRKPLFRNTGTFIK